MANVRLSTSDWVAIAVGIVQLLASVGIAAWTIRRTVPAAPDTTASSLKPKPWHLLWAWFKSSWLFVLAFLYAFHEVWSLAVGSEELSRALVLRMVLYAAYGVLNAVASVGFFIVQFQLDMMRQITNSLLELTHAHGASAEMQRKHLAVTERLLERNKPTRRRAR